MLILLASLYRPTGGSVELDGRQMAAFALAYVPLYLAASRTYYRIVR